MAMDSSDENSDNNEVDMERRALIMELAQQQQMSLEIVEEIIVNQRNIRDNFARVGNDDEQQQAGQSYGDGGEEENDILQQEEDQHQQQQQQEHQSNQPPPTRTRNSPTQQNRRQSESERHDGYVCSITQIYFIISALLAFLAVVTSPSNIMFAPIKVGLKQISASNNVESLKEEDAHLLQHAVAQNHNVENGAAAVDSYGNMNIIDKVLKKGEQWEAVVSQSKAKLATSLESSKKKDESQSPAPLSPSSTHSWSEMLNNFGGEVRYHFNEQYSVLQQLKLQVSLTPSHPQPERTQNPAVTLATDVKQPAASPRWLPPWDWMKTKRVNGRSAKTDDSLEQTDPKDKKQESNRNFVSINDVKLHSFLSPILRVVDPSLIQLFPDLTLAPSANVSQASPPTDISDLTDGSTFMTMANKVFSSTPRLIAIANLLLAVTYLLQTAVADAFLGPVNIPNVQNSPLGDPRIIILNDPASQRRRSGRERFGGFLLFKLLLVSAVLEPDSVDLFMLLSWYTLLSFLRSLAHLAGNTARHTSQSGEPPSPGVLRLLILVMACDVAAASSCVVLFRTTGVNMLLLLTSDCVLLGVDAMVHIVKYFAATAEEEHRMDMFHLEEQQVALHAQRRDERISIEAIDNNDDDGADNENNEVVDENVAGDDSSPLEDELHQIDQALELGEAAHSRCMARLDANIFLLEMMALLITIAHFIHIWALHGTSFGLVDGVLALHVHSTVSMIGKKVSERRNAHFIERELNNNFPDANDLDIRKASAAGDVCCICLNPMMVGGVKKVPCGHLFHTKCLREVVERERDLATAKCPLCRASLVTGSQDPGRGRSQAVNGNIETNTTNHEDTTVGDGAVGVNRQVQPAQQGQPVNAQLNPGEQSLLRFSTENILPAWLPVPAFAFEVVRRETTAVAEPAPNPDGGGGWQRFFRRGGEVPVLEAITNDDNAVENNEQEQPGQEQPQQQEASFWRRLLILVGAIPMSPEEEAAALEQLVEMFPQYDRADLLRELRTRRSAEAVAESILLGLFSGIPRGGGGVDVE